MATVDDSRICNAPNCNKTVYKNDLCVHHHDMMRYHGFLEYPTIICANPGCGKTFKQKRSGNIYCSKRCKNKAARESKPPEACRICGGTRTLAAKGLCSTCYSNQWRELNHEKFLASVRRYKRSHRDLERTNERRYRKRHPEIIRAKYYRRRLREQGGPQHTGKDELHVYRLAHGRCAYCNKPTPFSKGHIDHRVPLAKGGNNSIGNLEWSCGHCNDSKGAKLLVEWFRDKKKQNTKKRNLEKQNLSKAA